MAPRPYPTLPGLVGSFQLRPHAGLVIIAPPFVTPNPQPKGTDEKARWLERTLLRPGTAPLDIKLFVHGGGTEPGPTERAQSSLCVRARQRKKKTPLHPSNRSRLAGLLLRTVQYSALVCSRSAHARSRNGSVQGAERDSRDAARGQYCIGLLAGPSAPAYDFKLAPHRVGPMDPSDPARWNGSRGDSSSRMAR